MTAVAASIRARKGDLAVPAVLALAPLVLVLARFISPQNSFGLGLRLASASLCLLFVPGFLIVRLLARPTDPPLVVVASLAWSLVAIFAALATTFAFNRSLVFTLGLLVGICVTAALVGLAWNRRTRRTAPLERPEAQTLVGILAVGGIVGGVVWWAVPPISGDAVFHLARTLKLAEMPHLESVRDLEPFRDGSLHAGYAFPLWHGALALVARLAGVDSASVVSMLPAILTPFAFVAVYAAGAALFRSRWGGIAVLAGQVAIFSLPRGLPGLGIFETLSGPAHLSLLILVPAVLALAFAYVEEGERLLLASLGAASFVLTVVHAPYTLFVALALGGFAVTRLLVVPDVRSEAVRHALAIAAILVSACFFIIWLWSAVVATEAFTPDAAEKERLVSRYGEQLDFFGDWFRYKPAAISAGGAVTIAGLLAVPFAYLARRSRWSAFVLGSALPILAILLTPALFTAVSDLATLWQSRRLAAFLPLSFAFAGGAVLLGRLRIAGVAAAIGFGLSLDLLYPGVFTIRQESSEGPAWPVWIAAIGGAVAFVVAAVLRQRRDAEPVPSKWTALTALAFVGAVAALSLPDHTAPNPKPLLAPGLVQALRTQVEPGEVVFGRQGVSWRVAAVAPVYVAAGPVGHVTDRPLERIADVTRFYTPETSDAERRRLLSKYEATWLIVEKEGPVPKTFIASLEPVFDNERFTLYRLPPRSTD